MEKQIVGGTQFLVKLTFDILVSVLTEIGRSSKAYTELCGRTEVMVTDVLMALIDQGMQPQMGPRQFVERHFVEYDIWSN